MYILLLLTLGTRLLAQGVVEGTVSDARTLQPMEMVNIGIVGGTNGTTTDSRGRYKLHVTESDSVTIRFSFTGYEPQNLRVKVKGSLRMRNISLRPSAQQLDAVEVSDEKSRESSFTHIDVERIEAAVGPTAGVEGVLKTLPDVNSSNELSSQYSVRGGSFDENLVYINGVEVFRPMLIRSGQQEGMSIINPDLVSNILFSPGGFDARYGDKMSSVLDIAYLPNQGRIGGKVSASLLGASASVHGSIGRRWNFIAGLRQHSNRYILGSLDTKGSYTTNYTDFQSWITYTVNDRLEFGLLALFTRNVYGLVPESQTTAFGGFNQAMELDIYFDGAEEDRYRTTLGAMTFRWRPTDDWNVSGNISVQNISENERYDIQSQYFLYEVGMGEQVGETERFDRGVGTFLEHARNRLGTGIYAFDLNASCRALLGYWQMGVKLQYEDVRDRLREWRLVDSAGYAIPTTTFEPGDSSNVPNSPILQQYANSLGGLGTMRGTAYLQREIDLTTRSGAELKIAAGLRGTAYSTELESHDSVVGTGLRAMVSPRLSASYKPHWEHDLLFRIAAGIYPQAPFYREYRRADGSLNPEVDPQTSYQVMGTADWNLRIGDRPFKITADVYYKYITDLIPYTIDNLRISYDPDARAVAYATGLSLRINGDFVEGLESWASLSIMRTQEDIEDDEFGWLDRPTDQRFAFKVFLQDYIPDMPWWRMSLSMIYATGMPVVAPYGRQENALRLPSYLRVDWGNTVQLSRFTRIGDWLQKRHVSDVHVGVEVFNLFNFRNVISYLWVTDIDNMPRRVPNYLTARQLNFKISVLF